MKNADPIVKFLMTAGVLKRIDRAGWKLKKIKNPESIADHSWRTALMAWVLAPEGLDRDKIIKMTLLHDLAEAKIGDLTPHDKLYKHKHIMEERALKEIFSHIEIVKKREAMKLWNEFENGQTKEAKLSHVPAPLQEGDEKHHGKKLEDFFMDAENRFRDKELKRIFLEIMKLRIRTMHSRHK